MPTCSATRNPAFPAALRVSPKIRREPWIKKFYLLNLAPARDPNSPLERALARFGAALGGKDGIEQGSGPVSAD